MSLFIDPMSRSQAASLRIVIRGQEHQVLSLMSPLSLGTPFVFSLVLLTCSSLTEFFLSQNQTTSLPFPHLIPIFKSSICKSLSPSV